MAAVATFDEGQLVRLHGLKLLQARHNGSIAATQEYLPQKGLWRVRLASGEALEAPCDCLKPVDSQSRFSVGQVVRVRGVGVLHPRLDGSLVAVQEYLPQKDMWRVLTPTGEKHELYGENLKVLDPPGLFSEGCVVRVAGLQVSLQMMHNNKVGAIQEYVPLRDAWRLVLPSGDKLELHSENLRKAGPPDAFAEGDLVFVKGHSDPVAVQQYLPDTDQWRVRLPTGAALDVFAENIRRQGEAAPERGHAWEAFASGGAGSSFSRTASAGVGGLVDKIRRPSGASAEPDAGSKGSGGIFDRMRQRLGRGGYSGPAGRGGFEEGDVVHLCGLMFKSDGTMAVIQEWLDRKSKWRCRLNTGDAVEVASENLKPAADRRAFASGQLCRVSGSGKRALEGKTVAIQECVEAKGMWRVRLPSGEAADIWPSCLVPLEPSPGSPQRAAAEGPPLSRDSQHEQDDSVLDDLARLCADAGTSIDDVLKYSEEELTAFLRDGLRLPASKRPRYADAVRRRGAHRRSRQDRAAERMRRSLDGDDSALPPKPAAQGPASAVDPIFGM
eukprot:TRINITY_DN1446_c0_g3_i1.p2 TRINITY_DN1446_c0_g3~~TRINITY_DN1446_c0_g3_i1.p2  ORF type:complete len:578 (+),score=198.37 TRINITY_DN1446_c0_g3_i1:72-1736(+)